MSFFSLFGSSKNQNEKAESSIWNDKDLSKNALKSQEEEEKRDNESTEDNNTDENGDNDDAEEEIEDDDIEEDLDNILGDSDDEREKRWQPPQLRNARPPHPLTVTHIYQSHQLKLLQDGASAVDAEQQNSEEWLLTHSTSYLKLSLKDLVDKGKIVRLTPDQKTGKVTQHIQFDAYDVNDFEYNLNVAIEMYTKRIKWLLQGCKRMFGHLQGEKVAICVDTSDANMGYGRDTAFQEDLLHLIDEQLSNRSGIYLVSFGSDIKPLWSVVRDVNYHILEEAKIWATQLSHGGGTNLLKVMKHIMKLDGLDSVMLVLGSLPDQTPEILCDFVYQMCIGKKLKLHTVAYDCSNKLTNVTLKTLAESSNGKYHCYTASSEEQIYTSTDIRLLLNEIREAQDVINKIKEMRQGMMGNALISIMNEITSEVSKLPQSRFLPRPPGHDLPLRIEQSNFQPRASTHWLKQRGLKAKKLDLYQVLAPNAYSYKEEFIPVIKKAVQSQVHEKAMIQFPWHDGSLKNLHVDMTQLFEYQKQLSEAIVLYERRVDWLASGSRRIFGTVTEKNVVVLVDTSVSNINYLIHIQHSLRLLMQEQIANKDYFNIIAFGSQIYQWMPTMVRPTQEHLQMAWKWVLELQCGGSRNFLAGFRSCVENEEEIKHHTNVQGIYLFTSGVPDQVSDVILGYIEEASSGWGVKLHTILFNVDDYDANGAIPGRYANITRTAECLRNMAHCSGGRFHWFRETGIIESDDIQLVNAEIDKALNFSRKCALLVESVKKKYRKRFLNHPDMKSLESRSSYRHLKCLPAPEKPQKFVALAPPSTSSTVEESENCDKSSKSAFSEQQSNSSSSSIRQTAKPQKWLHRRPESARDPMKRVRPVHRVTTLSSQHFYIGDQKNHKGSVISKFNVQKSSRKDNSCLHIPEQEDSVTTKEWLKIYSLSKLKLDLNKLVMSSGADCNLKEKNIKILHKNIAAKIYPEIFPTVNVKGTLKYMQLMPHELAEYGAQLEKVLRRYLKRLQWLLSGSRRLFGSIVHKKVIFLIDTSGSMEPRMEELKKEIASLVWDQLHKLGIHFNFIQFSGSCTKWKKSLQAPTEANCHDLIGWASQLMPHGNTCTLEALRLAFEDPKIDAIYLLTDGKPDTSTSMVLREVATWNEHRNLTVNTISFNCTDSTANNFLRLLASETRGRYHRIHDEFDAELFIHKILSEGFADSEYPHLPAFEGDDLRKLAAEITQARKYLQQSRLYRSMYKEKLIATDRPTSAKGSPTLLSKQQRKKIPADV